MENNMEEYVDKLIEEEIEKYEKEHNKHELEYGEHKYYGFRDGKIYGITEEELIKELEEIDDRIKNGEEKCYSIDKVDKMMKSNQVIRLERKFRRGRIKYGLKKIKYGLKEMLIGYMDC